MARDDELQSVLLAVNSQLGIIEGKVNLLARAQRDAFVQALADAFKHDSLMGQIYLLINGHRTQQQIVEELQRFGIASTQPTISKKIKKLVYEFGVVRLVGGASTAHKDLATEEILNLSSLARVWLKERDKTIPEDRAKKTPKAR